MRDAEIRDNLQRRFLLVCVALVSLAFLWMIQGFLLALFFAALAAGLAHPLHQWCTERLGGREVLAAAIVVLLALFLLAGPAVALVGLVMQQALDITQSVTPWVRDQVEHADEWRTWLEGVPLLDRLPIESLVPDRAQLLESGGNAVRAMGSMVVDGAAAAGRTTATFFLQLFIMLYAMFFFLFQGPSILDRILYLAPLEPEAEHQLLDRFLSVTRATLKGSLLIGAIQGALAGSAFWLAGIQGAAFWGTVMMVLSVIPGVGAPLVWIPAVVWLLATGQTVAGVLLAAWCAAIVGSVDNVLRPRLVGSDAKMSDLMILLSTLGGIGLFGPLGFVAGPILGAVFLTAWDLYGEAFAGSLPATARIPAAVGEAAASEEP